jgi:type II secretion system protein N
MEPNYFSMPKSKRVALRKRDNIVGNSNKLRVAMVGIFFFSFMFFLYLSFPYGVLKEAISTKIEVATGISVRMESLGLGFPLGLTADNIEIYMKSSPKVKLKEVSVNFSLLQLLLLRGGLAVSVRDAGAGSLNVGIRYGLFSLLKGAIGLPSSISLSAKGFSLDSVTAFGAYVLAANEVGGPVAGPIIGKIGVKGKLALKSDISFDSSNVANLVGDLDFKLTDAVLVLSDPSFGFPDQSFKEATVAMAAANGSLVIEPSTRFTTQDLEIGVDGKVALKPKISMSALSLKAFMHLKGVLGEQFGSLIDAISNGLAKDGAINVQIGGTVEVPKYDPI